VDTIEHELRHMIHDLRTQLEILEETFDEKVKDIVKEILLENHLIESSAEDE
jgi:CHAD domain-containing protein